MIQVCFLCYENWRLEHKEASLYQLIHHSLQRGISLHYFPHTQCSADAENVIQLYDISQQKHAHYFFRVCTGDACHFQVYGYDTSDIKEAYRVQRPPFSTISVGRSVTAWMTPAILCIAVINCWQFQPPVRLYNSFTQCEVAKCVQQTGDTMPFGTKYPVQAMWPDSELPLGKQNHGTNKW